MDLTVILCTYNRCGELQQTLGSLAAQQDVSGIRWEVLLVDNNSRDATPDVVRQVSRDFPVSLRYVHEAKQGLSHARNRGIAEAHGRYVAFTEDDARADHGWVRAIHETFQRRSCDAVAGKIDLLCLAPIPRWITDELLAFLGYLDYGDEQILSAGRPPFGGNMAFVRTVFARIGLFDTNLGRQGKKLIGGEEIDLFERFLKAGFFAVYQPKALVHHVIDSERLKKSYFRKLHFNEGRVRAGRHAFSPGRSLAGIPLFLVSQLLRSISVFFSTAFQRGFSQSLRKEMNIWYLLGFMVQCAKQRRRRYATN